MFDNTMFCVLVFCVEHLFIFKRHEKAADFERKETMRMKKDSGLRFGERTKGRKEVFNKKGGQINDNNDTQQPR